MMFHANTEIVQPPERSSYHRARPFTPALHQMISDDRTMTITIGNRTFSKPDLRRRPEWNFDIKAEICGYPKSEREIKVWNQFYAEQLGCKFNLRFFAANYWLWIGNRFSQRTGNMLTYEGRHWFRYDESLVEAAQVVRPYINEAERDGLYHLVPLIIAHSASPQAIKKKIGRGLWRRAANNSVSRNVGIMKAFRRCPASRVEAFERLMDMPSGVLRAVMAADDDEVIAARITPKKRVDEFRQTVHLVLDTQRMLGDEFNPHWGYRRMQEEHERATRNLMLGRYSDKHFASDWTFEEGGYRAVLLTSKAEIATEGRVQHHCVASYAGEASMGRYAVFRIDGKERATAGSRGNVLEQVYGACNSRVSEQCEEFARRAVAKYSAGLLTVTKPASPERVA